MRGRQVVLTIETTGGHVYDRHHDEEHANRITEIAAVEMNEGKITGKRYSAKFKDIKHPDWPTFADEARHFLRFLANAEVLYHGKAFVESFVNAELGWGGYDDIGTYCHKVTDTVHLSRMLDRFLGKEDCKHSLDDLALRYDLLDKPRARRDRVAMRDCMLLANVYLKLEEEAEQNGISLDQLEEIGLPMLTKLDVYAKGRGTTVAQMVSDKSQLVNRLIAFAAKLKHQEASLIPLQRSVQNQIHRHSIFKSDNKRKMDSDVSENNVINHDAKRLRCGKSY